jgi:hypothetical protein
VGQLALLTGLFGSVAGFADSWARAEAALPARDWAAWLTTWLFPVSITLPLLLLLVFPTGRLASPRWRVVVAMVVVGGVFVAIGNAFTPEMSDFPELVNPMGIAAFSDSLLISGGIAWWSLLVGAALSAIGLVPRLRRARGVEREQFKWITYAAALQGASWILLALDLPPPWGDLAQYALFLTLAFIPISAGIAILRYRLYDIDVVIRRTLLYAGVVGVLAVVYVGLVLGSQTLLSGLTGNDTLPVALSTLAIAALFGPVRARIREAIDRRFFRARYDAQQTLAAFGARLRDEVELDAVGAALVGTAGRSVRPASASVWIRPR